MVVDGLQKALTIALGLWLGGCATTLGSRTVQPARFDYNQALARSWNEQLLLNLVRLRYRDTLVFLEVASVVNQYSFSGDAAASATANVFGSDKTSGTLGAGIGYSERPTVTYLPLKGESFVERLLSPLAPETLILLSQSGWSVERLLLCCVQQINGVPNAPSAAGPTPSYVPRFENFHALARLLRQLQIADELAIREKDGEIRVFVEPPAAGADVRRIRELLRLDDRTTEFRLSSARTRESPQEISLVGRSLLGVLFYLSQSVEPPAEHEASGWVTVTAAGAGQRFDWSAVTGALLRIRSSAERPRGAFVSIPYRGAWFSIDDADLNSKTTFGLLTYLFSLQAAGSRGDSPLLTISTGG